jgi:hypothetical protein
MSYTVLYIIPLIYFDILYKCIVIIMSFGQADESKFIMDQTAYKKDYM